MKSKLLFLSLFIFSYVFGNIVNPIILEKQISDLNDKHQYREAILMLEKIITNKNATPFDSYQAYLQKSYTYKRLYNYVEALNNLDLALNYGIQSPQVDVVKTQILLEKIFIEFDQKNFDVVTKLLTQVDNSKLHLITGETHAFYLSIVANIAMRKEDYGTAEKYLTQAIQIVAKQNPKHLSNIYRVKIALYGYTKEHEKVMDAYEKGLYYANKYEIDIYKIIMHEAICRYYTYKDDYKNAFLTQKIINEALTKYDSKNNNGRLSMLEKELLEEKKKNELHIEKNYRYFFITLSVISSILILVIFFLYRVTKQKKILAQKENKRMRKELEIVTQSLSEKGNKKIELETVGLSERQNQIVELVKQGKTNKEIGTILFISENTVKYHLKIIYEVLKVENRLGLK